VSHRIDLKELFFDRIKDVKGEAKIYEKRRYSIFNSEVFTS
jgi:hypothetical protein